MADRLDEVVLADLGDGLRTRDAVLELAADQLKRLGAIPPPVGDRYEDMSSIGR